MRKLQSGGVTASKQPRNYTDLERWNRTLTCYSGIIAYRFMFLDSVSTHLRLEYEFQNKSKILLEKHADFNVNEFTNNKLFNVKSTLFKNNVNNCKCNKWEQENAILSLVTVMNKQDQKSIDAIERGFSSCSI